MSIETIIFYILLVDAIAAVIMSFGGGRPWWQRHLGRLARYFPLAHGWTVYYLILVLFIGWILYSGDLLVVVF